MTEKLALEDEGYSAAVSQGRGARVISGEVDTVEKGDLMVVPSWATFSLQAETGFTCSSSATSRSSRD